MDSFEKFFDEKEPDRCEFFSSLKDECVSEKEYSYAIDIWNVFKVNTMGDYHDFYLKTDVCYCLMFLKGLLTHLQDVMD